MRTKLIFLIVLAAVAIMTAGCTITGPTASPTALPTSQPGPVTATPGETLTPAFKPVTIKGFAFDPAVVEIPAGGTVTWTNQDGTAHTVKFSDGESPVLQNGGTYSKKFDTAGVFDYSCGIHPSMKGTVKVT